MSVLVSQMRINVMVYPGDRGWALETLRGKTLADRLVVWGSLNTSCLTENADGTENDKLGLCVLVSHK